LAYQTNGYGQRHEQDVAFYKIFELLDLMQKPVSAIRKHDDTVELLALWPGVGDTDIGWDMLDLEVAELVTAKIEEWISSLA
jgi:hypothetical protein